MTFKIVCPVNDNQVTVSLPPDFKNKKQVIVYIEDLVDQKSSKIDVLKLAASDPLFLADIMEVQQDFDSIDHETL
jgi:hypothetical protein